MQTPKPLSLLALVLLAACRAETAAPAATGSTDQMVIPADPLAVHRSGEQVYQLVCASCHGVDGDGKGAVVLDRPARSFRSGAFSFGNTPEALFRTVSNGIGGTPMPGFAALLSAVERRRVVDYLIAFGPKRTPDAGDAAIMVVRDRPVVVRGQLASVAKGAPASVRGLMVGTLDGLSWMYDASDLRLLVVRQGAFVKRSDWTGRGGTPLQPLGQVIHTLDGGQPGSAFRLEDGNELQGVLRSTRIEGREAWIRYDLQLQGRVLASVAERAEAFSTKTTAGYRRHLDLLVSANSPQLLLSLCAGEARGAALAGKDGTLWIPTQQADRWVVFGLRSAGLDLDAALQPGGRTAIRLPARERLSLVWSTLLLPDDKPETWRKLQEELR